MQTNKQSWNDRSTGGLIFIGGSLDKVTEVTEEMKELVRDRGCVPVHAKTGRKTLTIIASDEVQE